MRLKKKGVKKLICENCLENNHCKDIIKCDCNICNDNE
jgi:hypothetical protein